MRTLLRTGGLLMLCALASCGGGGSGRHAVTSAPLRFATPADAPARYRAPGGPRDPWGPYIAEASTRYNVPQSWIRAVMRQESGGHEYMNGQPITSYAGAMGLMQLTGQSYRMLRDRYGLGDDPYDPHDNIMAGTAYIAELYRRYGKPQFLAAYNDGPGNFEAYLAGRRSLPDQTVQYLASVGPRLTDDVASPADTSRVSPAAAPAATADEPVQVAEAPPPPAPAQPQTPPRAGFSLFAPAYADTVRQSATDPRWGVQVGAFADAGQARAAADNARQIASRDLAPARTVVGAAPTGLYRARLVGVTRPAADDACQNLTAHRWDCLIVPPGG